MRYAAFRVPKGDGIKHNMYLPIIPSDNYSSMELLIL